MKRHFFSLLLFFVVVMCVEAQDIKQLTIRAGKNDAEALVTLASCYIRGEHVPQDFNRAFSLLNQLPKNAKRDYRFAADYLLGVLYFEGKGTAKNYKEAFQKFYNLCLMSYDNYVPDVGYYLGRCYFEGLGTAVDMREARTSFFHSAMLGSQRSRITLAYLCGKVKEVVSESDYKEIFDWILEEANKKDAEACYYLASLYRNGYGCTVDLSKAVERLEESARLGYEDAKYELVRSYYLNDSNHYMDYKKAYVLLSEMANNNDSWAQYQLGVCYISGKGVETNIDQGFSWWKKAANQNDPEALFALGQSYYEGRHVQKDYAKSVDYLKKYINNKRDARGNSWWFNAKALLGNIYYEGGFGVEQDYEQAVRYYLNLEVMTAEAARNLAICYKWGYGGLPQSEKKSDEWLKTAKELGDKVAEHM